MVKSAAPVRIQRSRNHKQVSPNGLPIIYVGRPSKYGNDFRVHSECTNKEAVEKFIKYQLPHMDLTKLRGANLSCWCKVGQLCHGDILLKEANK